MLESMKYLLQMIMALALLGASSCVMPGDVDRIFDGQAQLAAEQAQARAEYREGNLSWEAYLAKVAESNEKYGELLIEVKDEIAARPEAILTPIKETAEGMSTGGIVGGISAAVLALAGLYAKTKKDAVVAVNRERDYKRSVLGPGYQPPPTAPS